MPRRHITRHNLPRQIYKRLVHIPSCPGTRFVVRCPAPALRDTEGAGTANRAVFFQVALVANDDEGGERVILDAHNLVAEGGKLVEGGERGYTEDEEEALARFHVELTHRRWLSGFSYWVVWIERTEPRRTAWYEEVH